MANNDNRRFRAGDEVIVRSPGEILSTLDSDGTLDGLPFMPEMVSLCGKKFRVARRVEKTCVEGHSLQQRFPAADVVFLEEQRCTGEAHDGCSRGCMIFWKEAWLRGAGPNDGELTVDADGSDLKRLFDRLKVKTDSAHYFCQSTQLAAATRPFPGKQSPWMVWVALREIWFGSRSVAEVVRLVLHWIRLIARRQVFGGDRKLIGTNKRTPTEALNLVPGEHVQIKSLQQILETLDGKQRNRGLRIAYAMTRNCGVEYEVERRVDRMISETTGEMREVRNTVALRGLECLCYYECLGCPRGDLQYWREIWLERVPGRQADDAARNTSG